MQRRARGMFLGMTYLGTVAGVLALTTPVIAQVSSLRASVQTDRDQYFSSRAVEIYLGLQNFGNRDHRVSLSRGFEFDVFVREARTNRVVWQWSRGQVARGVSFNIASGDARQNRVFWNRRDNDGRLVPEGVYLIEARLFPQSPVTTQIYLGDSSRDGRGDGRNDPRDGRGGGGFSPARPGAIPTTGIGAIPMYPPAGAIPMNPGAGVVGGFPGSGVATGGLSGVLRPDRSAVRCGEWVNLTYILSNTSSQVQRCRFSSGRQFDFDWRAQGQFNGGPFFGRGSQGMVFGQAFQEIVLLPGEVRTLRMRWQVPNQVPVGAVIGLNGFLTPVGASDFLVAPCATQIVILR